MTLTHEHLYLLAGASGFLVTAGTLPLWIALCRRWQLIDEPGARKIHAASIPLAGGLAIAAGLLSVLIAGAALAYSGFGGSELSGQLSYGFGVRGPSLTIILAGALGMLLLGLGDDRFELRPAVKFSGQLVIALAVAASGVRITLFVGNIFFSYAITVLWILTVTNAFNFMDNMNGLCGGLGVIASSVTGYIAASHDQYLVASLCCVTAGALAGFLPYNFPRARTFLGDAGSHLIGYLMAVLTVLPHFHTARHPNPWAVLAPLLILALPLIDLGWVVLLRIAARKPFYIGDTNHLSHRLVRRGWSKPAAVLWIWGMALAGGLTAIALSA